MRLAAAAWPTEVATDGGGACGAAVSGSDVVGGAIRPFLGFTFCPGIARWMPPMITWSCGPMPLRITRRLPFSGPSWTGRTVTVPVAVDDIDARAARRR